jgi:hypothetical protein
MYPQETVDAAKAVLALATEIAKLGKDGFQLSDALVLAEKLKAEPLAGLIAKAQENADKIPAEVKDIDLISGFKVALDLGPDLIALVESLKKA